MKRTILMTVGFCLALAPPVAATENPPLGQPAMTDNTSLLLALGAAGALAVGMGGAAPSGNLNGGQLSPDGGLGVDASTATATTGGYVGGLNLGASGGTY